MDFLHHPWIFEHENVRTEDDGYIDVDFRAERINTMIKTVWSEFQEKNKIRIQFLCIVLDSTFDGPDEYLKKVMGVGDDIYELIATRGEVFLAPIAVRSPGGFSARGQDFRLDYNKICHPVTTRIADDITFCYHVTEFKNDRNHQRRFTTWWPPRRTNSSFPQSICAMGQALQGNPGRTIDTPRTTSHGPILQRSSTHESWSHDQRIWSIGGQREHSIL